MTAEATDTLVDAIEASYGLPVPTPLGFANRIEEQLYLRGYRIAKVPSGPAEKRIQEEG